jgi:hypothetical protein
MKDDAVSNVSEQILYTSSTIETIDGAMFDWIDNVMDLRCSSNTGFVKPSVIWVSAERAFLTKKERKTRDVEGYMNYPLLSLERVSIAKDPTKKGTIWGNVPPVNDEQGGSITISRRINQDKSTNFGAADSKAIHGQINFPRKNKKIVYQTISIPMVVYIEVTYNVHIRTIYQQQMNELLQPFIVTGGGINAFILKYEGHRFEAFIDKDYQDGSNMKSMGTEERKFVNTVSIRVLGYLVGGGVNQKQPQMVIRENAVDVKIARERIVVGDENLVKGSDGFVGVSAVIGRKTPK